MKNIEPTTAIIVITAILLISLMFVHPTEHESGVWAFIQGDIWLSEKCDAYSVYKQCIDTSADIILGYRWVLIAGIVGIGWAVNKLIRRSN